MEMGSIEELNGLRNGDFQNEVFNDWLKGTKEKEYERMCFNSGNEIVLYTGLNNKNAELLKAGMRKNVIIAYEYPSLASRDQAEKLIALGYKMDGLYDTLRPAAFGWIRNMVKSAGYRIKNISDEDVVNLILRNYTGVRVHHIEPSEKCYEGTHTLFGESRVMYILKPDAVRILGEREIED